MDSKYYIVIQYNKLDRLYIASAPELEGCVVQSKTQIQALRKLQEAISRYIENFPERCSNH